MEGINLQNIAQQAAQQVMREPANPQDEPGMTPIESPEAQQAATDGYNGPGKVVFGAQAPQVTPKAPEDAKGPAPVGVGLEGINLEAAPTAPNAAGSPDLFMGVIPESQLIAALPGFTQEEIVAAEERLLSEGQRFLSGLASNPNVPAALKENQLKQFLLKFCGTLVDEKEAAAAEASRVNVVIDKSREKNLEFTPDEKEKMSRAKSLRLIVVENKELEAVKTKKIDAKHSVDMMHSMLGGLSKYSIPMPSTGDFFTFRGAQIMQLASIVSNDDESFSEALMRKAHLLYDKFIGGTVIQKKEPLPGGRGYRTTLSFEDFCNQVAYADVDMGLYAILCAGQMEESKTMLKCQRCNKEYEQAYNTKQLLSQDNFSDAFKERTDFIIANSYDREVLKTRNAVMREAIRYKSPFTGNIYDVSIPSIAKANQVFLATKDTEDEFSMYISAMALYVDRILVWSENDQCYIEINCEEGNLPLLIQTLAEVPDEDTKMLMEQIQSDYIYNPTFKLEAVCPDCGNKTSLPLSINQLVFQKAQDFYTATP